MIVTLTGASGSGKTRISKELRENPKFIPVISHTTRSPRDSDLPGEYECVTEEQFIQMKKDGEFLWTTSVRNCHYGTSKKAIQEAAQNKDGKIFLMLLVPEVLHLLVYYLKNNNLLRSFFIQTSKGKILKRLKEEGIPEKEIDKRLNDGKDWEKAMKDSLVPYVTILNDGDLSETLEKIRSAL